MCGIVGIVSATERPVLGEEVRAMAGAIVHRGPDDDGFYVNRDAGLGMRRLSIIDLDTGKQPICNEDGSVWIVFNGEIYNYRELRRNLQGRGHVFSTSTDTEVIVHLYEDFGADCVKHLRGMFGFAIWDDRRKQVLLARDRLGIKPLYFTFACGRLVFASELKAILQLPEISREIDWESASELFTFLTTPPRNSIIKGIRKLEPGHTLTFGRGTSPREQCYWKLQFQPDYNTSEDGLIERLRDVISESVSLHMVSDVPVGAFLSGGVDSASVVAEMALKSSAPVKTFSIGFHEAQYNELDYARLVSRKYATDHYELILEPDVIDSLEDIIWHLDEPFGDSSAIPTFMVSKLAAQHVKVVLSGDGGDECFAGYDKYFVALREQRFNRIPIALRTAMAAIASRIPYGTRGRNALQHFSLAEPQRYLDSITLFRMDERHQLFQDGALEMMRAADPYQERLEVLRTAPNWLSALQALDCGTYLPLDILTKVDRMSMAHSLEVRPPLLDHKLLEFAATIPPQFLASEGEGKRIFKKAMKELVPREVLDRPKRGFAIPLKQWFRGRLAEYARDILFSEQATRRGIFRRPHIERLLEMNSSGRDLDLHLWTIISFELWCRTFLDSSHCSAKSHVGQEEVVAGAAAI